jgi:hypothetical protein
VAGGRLTQTTAPSTSMPHRPLQRRRIPALVAAPLAEILYDVPPALLRASAAAPCPSIAPVASAMLPPEPIRPARGGTPLLLRLPSTTWRTLPTAGCRPHSYAARLIEEKVREGLGVDPRSEAAVDVRWGWVSPGDPNGGKMRDAGVALGRSRGRCSAARDHYSGQIASLGSRWGGRRTVDLVRVLAW